MNHFTLRFAVAVLAPLVILQPNIGHCAPAAATSTGEVRMDHISVTETGKGSPVILIPGLSSPRAVWDGVVPELAKSHRVILVQVNGFAGDDAGANLKPGVLDGIVGDLHGYIAQHKLQGAAVVGHSMGGLVGLMLAKEQPGDVGKLMIVDSLPWYGMLFGPGATVDAVKPQAAAMRDRFAASYGKPDAAANQAMAARFALRPDAQAKVAGWMGRTDTRVSAEAMYEDMITDLRGDMGKIATPITMLYPTSAALPKAVAEPLYTAAYKDAPHATLVEVPDSAHFIMLDQPEVFLKAVTAFAG
ncbi:alpha/beta hydrolase [Sphingomonas sp.]|uniref:alpha/beta fold hydrolase n=1 Tax=Sphingomonas sp. TaxID=28214 RepID=UPI0025E23F4B|nr:alpha/beta hydrolase [Sphingomonas sp.]